MKNDISIEYLNECFHCHPETGKLYWKERPLNHFTGKHAQATCNGRQVGKEAGCKQRKDKFVQILIMGRSHPAHRIIYAMTHGQWPDGPVRHIDGNRLNNKIENLKLVSYSELIKDTTWGAK